MRYDPAHYDYSVWEQTTGKQNWSPVLHISKSQELAKLVQVSQQLNEDSFQVLNAKFLNDNINIRGFLGTLHVLYDTS